MLSERWSVELLAAAPFEHDIDLKDGTKVGRTKHLPPTVSLQYHFMPDSAFQPYVGAGLNFTWFFDDSKEGGLKAVDEALGVNTSLDVDSTSFGLAAQVGFDYQFGNNWFLNVDVRYIDISTDVTLKADGAKLATASVDVDPVVYGAHIGYKF
jgi:outer membrane protein